MDRIRLYSLTVALLIAVVMTVGCQNRSTTGTMATPYGTASRAALTITDTINAGAAAVNQLQVGGSLTPAEAREALTDMQAINALDSAFGACVEAAHTTASQPVGYSNCTQRFLTTLQTTPLFKLSVKDSSALTDIKAIGSAVMSVLNLTLAQIETPPGGVPVPPAVAKP